MYIHWILRSSQDIKFITNIYFNTFFNIINLYLSFLIVW